MGGSGSGGGGGSSGSVEYPDYMKNRHKDLWASMWDKHVVATNNNPYIGMYGWDPSCMIQHMQATVDYYDHIIQEFEPLDLWKQLMGIVPDIVIDLIDSSPLNEYIDQQKIRLRQGIEDDVLPKYRRGMQDIGAVMTSAFKIGEALLWARELQEEAALEKEFRGKLALAAYEYIFKSAGDIISLTLQKINYHKEVTHYNMEALRLGYVAMKEFVDSNNLYEVEKVKWPLEMSKYMMDSLGCIASSAGTSYTASSANVNKVGSAIGGALAGAGAGAMMTGGNPIGAAAGGAVGLVAGLFG